MSVKTVSILGVTGSIGTATADVILSAPGSFDVRVVSADTRAEELGMLAVKLGAKKAIINDERRFHVLKDVLEGSGIEAACGRQALIEAASEPVDIVLAAIVGVAGLEPLMAAIAHSKAVAIANKEPLVAAGALVMALAKNKGCKIIPVDSEHNAIFQVFEVENRHAIERIILTASGGPFLKWSRAQIAAATPEQAIKHPNWEMGAKISVDSASMMNKALEVIEAHYLFDMPADKIDVLIHPQSIVHSMVEYVDGSVLAQMGASDMRTPITYALGWPERIESPGQKLDFTKALNLDFSPLDMERFPVVSMAYKCLQKGQAACIAFNAANEIAVQAFLDKRIGFLNIMDTIDFTLESVDHVSVSCLDDVIVMDKACCDVAAGYIKTLQTKKVI